jgi:hypothetical protein
MVHANGAATEKGAGSVTAARQLSSGRVLWLVFFAIILALTGTAGVIASVFAAAYKPHTELHWQIAYALVWLLLVIYAWTFRSGRPWFSAQVWLFWTLLVAALVWLHLDDVAPAPMLVGDALVLRPRAPALLVAAGLDVGACVVLTTHVLVRKRVALRSRRRAAEAAAEDPGA